MRPCLVFIPDGPHALTMPIVIGVVAAAARSKEIDTTI
jgi:hypothetical protein